MSESRNQRPQLQAHFHGLQLRAWSHAVTMRLARIRGNAEYHYNTASGVLIQFSQRALVATAWHVLEEFQRLRDTGEEVVIVCDNMPILAPRTAFRDEGADIAFVEVPVTGRSGLNAVPYRPGRLWPPPAVKAGDTVSVCCFPKLLRQDGNEILQGDLNLVLDVASAGEKYFWLQINYENMIDAGRSPMPKEHVDFGGASGGPVFLADAEGNPLVGLISQAGSELPLWRIASLAQVLVDVAECPCEPL